MGEIEAFGRFCAVLDRLLGENGCPWDKAQTVESLRQYLLEESYEAVDAINNGDYAALKEELGDVLLEALLMAKVAEKDGRFSLAEVIDGVSGKMISRHTHIFGDDVARTPEEVSDNWERIKKKEKSYKSVHEELVSIPKALPALARAEKALKRSGAPKELSVSDKECLKLDLERLLEMEPGSGANEPLGEFLLRFSALARHLEINQEFSLTNATEKFINRFESEESRS
jgi:tetrapyrrole methylase family protein/MazG family protein